VKVIEILMTIETAIRLESPTPARTAARALANHWPEYLMEAGLLGAFMVSGRLIPSLKRSDKAREVFDELSRVREAVRGVAG
jgi:hypothetical protein